MAKFSVKYRKNGVIDFLEVDAPNRAAVFPILDAKGISAIQVFDGPAPKRKSGAPSASSGGKSSGNAVSIIVALIVLAALGGAVWWFIFSSEKPAPAPAAPEPKVEAEAPAKPATPAAEPKVKQPKKSPKSVEDAFKNLEEELKPVPIKKTDKPVNLSRYTNTVFKTGVEQLLSWVFCTEVGEMPMPMPEIAEDDMNNLVGILVSKNTIEKGDSEGTAEQKRLVDLAKAEMIKFIEDGGHPDDFLQHYNNELIRAFELRVEAQAQYCELYQKDKSLAEEFRKKLNERLEKDGIKLIEREVDDDAPDTPEPTVDAPAADAPTDDISKASEETEKPNTKENEE